MNVCMDENRDVIVIFEFRQKKHKKAGHTNIFFSLKISPAVRKAFSCDTSFTDIRVANFIHDLQVNLSPPCGLFENFLLV